ncbi:Vacuolar protein sorting-associated protein 13C [Labeo rohita]|uniref:Vacuolar protein sorting-associated protein 13C n=1 Tax=Labeo rohita TaxID=84645 RepID=A0ABQ8MLD4_LABRO|nr:Vacuolar protein sorting-associated protein 13C [Labeo rohita]
MVFESLVSDLLNRFIGDYVENLDKSQLKIGIWGGNVVLENLRVKENALSEFDVPFKVKAGQIGKLTLKIPWKNLYNEAVVATLDGLYLLVVPGATIKYDPAKEERYLQEAKQKELQRIEETLQLVARRGSQAGEFVFNLESYVYKNPPREKPQEEKKDTFAEKLATQVIKNLQVKITSIHIRYEDDTADENWKTCILNEAAKIIYKDKLKAGISTKNEELQGYQYIFKPIFASARMWKYSINSILEVHIRRFNQMWNWNNIKKHRNTLKAYKAAYKFKLTQGKVREDTEKQIQVIRSGQKLVAKKAATQKQSGGGFFSSFFGKKEGKKKEEEEDKEPESIDSIMTPEEKTKLYTAIGYSGSSHNLALPKHYVAVIVNFKLLSTSVTFREEPGVPEILKVQMIDLSTSISQRPGAQAIRVEAKLEHWYVTGLQQQGEVPSLIASLGDTDSSLLSVLFELNPEDSTADQLLRVHSQPMTVIGITEFFKTGKGVDLEVITSATLSKLEEIKEKTATGLSHIIETRKVLDLRIDLKPSYLLLPKSGFYDGKSDLMIVDFGYLQLNSVDQGSHQQVSASFSSLEEIMDRAYERYSLELRSVQILYSKSGEQWKNARLKGLTHQHILQPMDFTLQLAKCMVDKDSRMPRFKVSGELPLLHVKISDQKIQGVLELVNSIPLPQTTSTAPSTPTEKVLGMPLSDARPKVLGLDPTVLSYTVESDTDEDISEKSTDEDSLRSTLEELTEVQFQFEVKAVLLELTRQAAQEDVILALNVSQLGAEGKIRTFDLTVTSYLRKVSLDYCEIKDSQNMPLHLITSSDKHGSDLLKVEYIKADVNGPSFHTLFNNTEQTLKQYHKISQLQKTEKPRDELREQQQGRQGSKDSGVVNFKLSAVLGSFRVAVCDDRSNIADIRVQGIDASVVVQAKETDVFARLRDIVVLDVDPKTIHKKAVSIVGEEVFSFKLTLYPGATEGEGYTDTSKVDGKVILRLGCIQIVYLHKFLMSLLDSFSYQYPSADEMFVDNFQTAKEALTAATAQAAEKAASSVRDFAQKSFRLAMDIRLKAPLIIIPQSSTSHNAFVVDLGLITVGNSFSLLAAEGFPLPAHDAAHLDVEILEPINLELLVKRNLAATWYSKIPGMEVNGVLMSMNMALGQEDVGVLMRILAENIGEGSKAAVVERTKASAKDEAVDEGLIETLPVMLKLKKSKNGKECPFLVLHAAQLGINTKVRKYDMEATTYIKTISMKCLEFLDSNQEPLCIISSSAESGADLLEVKYFKADRNGPNFASLYQNTEQKINVVFSSLDLMLHTEALLSTMDFLSAALSDSSLPSPERESKKSDDMRTTSAKSTALSSPSDGDVIDLMVNMQLGAFNVLVCDQKSNMADIKIQGLDGSLKMQGTQTHMTTRLRDFIIMNAISIVGDEVFSFSMSLTPKATEGAGYTDTSKVDGKVKLNVGCIQVVYLHKFVMSLLNFSNNFQTAKEALSAATAQAAEKAASSVRDFAQKSFRLAMNIRLKAPLIIIPQSSTSHNAVEADLGLITVGNSFSLLPVEGRPLPAVIDNMDIQLTQLKLSRISMEQDSNQPSSKLLEPVNLVLSVKRNLAASWYQKMAALEVDGDLKPMKVALSQDDLTVLLRILMENIGEASSVQSDAPIASEAALKQESVLVRARTATGSEILVEKLSESKLKETELLESVKFSFNVESLGLTLYSNNPAQPSVHEEQLCLGEFMLRKMKTSGKMFNNGNMEVSTILTTCTLDDRRNGIQRVTSRMLGRRDEETVDPMIDVTYSQNADERSVVAVLQKLYLCASVEFLLAVADFFMQALPSTPKTKLRAVVVDPEVVFVANLMKADAPALVASFQCDFSLMSEDMGQFMKANVRSLKVLACPFIRKEGDKAETTVLRPCSVVLQTKMPTNAPLTGSITISPIILNTVITITAAMAPKPKEEPSQQTSDDLNSLWSLMNVANANYWFLGVDTASEVTESFKDVDSSKDGESFEMNVKVVQVTLESGLGHRTVPLLLAESSFTGTAQNWSSLLSVSADMTLEVNYFNETHAIWEPLLERVDSGKRRWNLKLDMKNNPVRDKSPVPGDDFVMLPEPRTAITICSKDTMNITVSKCCLSVFNNLAKHSANLRLTGSSAPGKLHELAVDKSVDLEHSSFERSARLSALQRQESCLFNLSVGYSEISNIPLGKPGRRLYNIRGPMQQDAVSVLLQIDASEGNKVITVRSPLQIKNHFSVPFAILKYSSELGVMVNVGVAEPEKECHVPLEAYRSQLFLLPVGPLEDLYRASATCIAWKEQVHVSSEVHAVLQCPAIDSSFLPLVVNTLAMPDDLSHIASHGEGDWDPAYVIHLHPAGSADFCELQEGSAADVLNSNVGGEIMELVLIKYQGRNWTGRMRINKELPEFLSICFTSDTSEGLTVDLWVHVSRVSGKIVLSIFSPYWIINKTSRVLQYRAEDKCVKHPSDFRDVILFSFKKKNFFSKNKLQLCVSTSSWSDGFSLDTVGSYGCVRCPDKNGDYLVGVSIQMSSFNLTRIVTMSPFYTLVNKSSFELEVGEVQNNNGSSSKWHYISSTEVSAEFLFLLKAEVFLQHVCVDCMIVCVLQCLPFWPESSTGKLCVRVVGSESSSKSFFFNKQDNGTLLRMEQYGGVIVDVNISDHSTVISFTDYYDGAAPALVVNHTPAATVNFRQSCEDHSGELDLVKDECGQFAYSSLVQIHWVSFLDGRQRVLIFTEDVGIVTKARQAEELEQFQQEVNISLRNLGLSLINNDIRQEIAYVGITSSGVVWEMRPKNRWKSFNHKNIELLEKAYQAHINSKSEPGWIRLETGLEVNFGRFPMLMRQPYSCTIRRNFLPGIRIELKQSPHQRSLRAQLYWLQVDNQLPGAIFPTVFHPVPLPKSIVQDSEPKPFIDVSIITRFNEHSQLHLSLSLGSSGDDSEQGDMVAIQSVNLLLKSIGATLTDVDDLIFKLAYFEVKYQFYRREKLMWAVIRHYTEQFLTQMYVLVLGLDVLGNPFGLIRGLSEGGAVQGPEEFAEGFVIGVKSLLGHTVGGAAGMVSRITGTVGKGLAAITMDKEYQQKRREEMNRPTKDFGESLAKGGKGFLKGVVGGVTGIVTKPVEGYEWLKESTEEVNKLRPVRLIQEDGIIRPYDHHASEGYDLFQRSEIKQLDGEVFREHYEYPGHRKTNIIITNRRVMCVKEIDVIGHFNKEWECQFENFQRPPSTEGGDLKIYYREQNKLNLIRKDGQTQVKVINMRHAGMAERLRERIDSAQFARKQYQMARQKSQRFIKMGNV